MRYRDMTKESRLDRMLATRVSDLDIYARKLLGMKRFPFRKYEDSIPKGLDPSEIESIAYAIRGKDYRPAVFVHGVLARSGTNYLADLLERHPDIYAHPRQLWEFPLLSITGHVVELQNDFVRASSNAGALKPLEFPALLGSGLLCYLQHVAGDNKTILLKFPYVHHVDLFRVLFPRDYLILLLRDGRDVVSSSMKSFRTGIFRQRFSDYCGEWEYGARKILTYSGGAPNHHPRTFVLRYEELARNPERHVSNLLGKLELDAEKYDYAGLNRLPVRGSSELAEQEGGIHWKPISRAETFSPIGRWKKWPIYKKRKFKSIAGDTLIAAGYEDNDKW